MTAMTMPPPLIPGSAEPFSLATVMPAPVKPDRPGWVLPVVVGLVVLILVLGGVVAWALNRSAGDPQTGPSAFPVRGAVTLQDSISVLNLDNVNCTGMGRYADLKPGAALVVSDASDATVGLGQLGAGTMIGSGSTRQCQFPFEIAAIPAGKGFYGIQVEKFAKTTQAEADLHAFVSVTLS